ncbi:hypothetical protein [Pseudoruegeria sp. SK021]|uniref:hypothetical protein n=1 Tax=Pseudoruegeria sp. SK021 TaxID=1933035 RepID=UPI001F0AE752|nr:hypothetical protein [Pseudoruegeria sp. SK021]
MKLEVRIMSALNLIYKDRLSFGIELPLDRDWSEAGQRRARIELSRSPPTATATAPFCLVFCNRSPRKKLSAP